MLYGVQLYLEFELALFALRLSSSKTAMMHLIINGVHSINSLGAIPVLTANVAIR